VPLSETTVEDVTARDVTVNVALAEPPGMLTLAGTVAAVLLLDKVTVAPPVGAAALSVAVPCALALPPTTVVGLTARDASAGAADGACTVKLRVADQLPATPELFRARTRHQYCRFANADVESCDGVTVVSIVRGAVNPLESSTCT
jgi:hypothetical protein